MHRQMSNGMVAVVSGHRDLRENLQEMMKSQKKPREAAD